MDFIELTLDTTKKKVSIRISKIAAIFEISGITRIDIGDDYYDVVESYETVMEMLKNENNTENSRR